MQQIGVKYGLIAGLIYVALQLVTNLMGLAESPNLMMGILFWALGFGITFFLIFTAIKTYRDEVNGGAMSIGAGIKMALLVSLIAGVIVGLYSILNMTVIDPDASKRALETARDQWEAQNMSDDQIASAEKWTKSMTSPAFIVPISIIWISIGGLIKGLISGAILSKEATPTV